MKSTLMSPSRLLILGNRPRCPGPESSEKGPAKASLSGLKHWVDTDDWCDAIRNSHSLRFLLIFLNSFSIHKLHSKCVITVAPSLFVGLTESGIQGVTRMSMLKEFKEFAVKGNVVDMAVGIIIGVAFGKIVSSFVADVLMPPIGMLIGGVDFSNLMVTLKAAEEGVEAVTLRYGMFLQAVFDFVIVAFAVFMAVKALNSMRKKEAETPAAPPAPSAQEQLLMEIRDLLKQKP